MALCLYICIFEQKQTIKKNLIVQKTIKMKVKFGAIVTDGRGKLGGHVLAKNRSGNYMRTKVTPVNPQTTFQQAQRAALGTLSSGWSGLTDAQRNSWNNAVDDFQRTDIFGDLKTPTGKNLYTGLNRNLLNSGEAILLLPPNPDSIANVAIDKAELGIVAATYDIDTLGTSTGEFIQAWATPALSAGTSFIKNRLRLIETAAGGVDTSIDIYALYIARFGVPAVGSNLYVAVRVINAGGEAGVIQTFKATVVA